MTLTHEQQQAFTMIQSNRRLLVSGGAGTGKTLLAMEDARQQALAGKKTLFLCFNRLLAAFLKQALDSVLADDALFHCFHDANQAISQEHWNRPLPNLVLVH